MRRRVLLWACAAAVMAVALAAVAAAFAVVNKSLEDRLAACVSSEIPATLACSTVEIGRDLAGGELREVLAAVNRHVESQGRQGAIVCHPLTEAVGIQWARLQGLGALKDLEYSCLGGAMHGVFYTLGQEVPARELAPRMAGLCEQFGRGRAWVEAWDCRHGVGHALALDESITIEEAFKYCAQVYSSDTDRQDCGTGVMGSLIARVTATDGGSAGGFDARSPWDWCTTHLDGPDQQACLQRAVTLAVLGGESTALRTTPVDQVDFTSLCPTTDTTCGYSIGQAVGAATVPARPDQRIAACRALSVQSDSPVVHACVAGLVRQMTPEHRLFNDDPGLCQAAGDLAPTCREETRRMNARELTMAQILGREPVDTSGQADPAPWPRD